MAGPPRWVATAIRTGGEAVTHLDPGADALTADSLFEIGSVTKTFTPTLRIDPPSTGPASVSWPSGPGCGRCWSSLQDRRSLHRHDDPSTRSSGSPVQRVALPATVRAAANASAYDIG